MHMSAACAVAETDGNIGIVSKRPLLRPLVSVLVSFEAFLSLGISPSIDPEACAFFVRFWQNSYEVKSWNQSRDIFLVSVSVSTEYQSRY